MKYPAHTGANHPTKIADYKHLTELAEHLGFDLEEFKKHRAAGKPVGDALTAAATPDKKAPEAANAATPAPSAPSAFAKAGAFLLGKKGAK